MSLEDDLLNLREAAEITGLSEMTIRKYLGITKPPRPSRLPNARKIRREGDTQDTWAIPLSDLHNAGLMKKAAKATKRLVEAGSDLSKPLDDYEELKIEVLRAENALLKRQIELLEANLADLRLMLGRSIETAETQERRKKFWRK